MLTGIKTHFHPNPVLSETLTQWIGCARVIYRAKCEEDNYLRAYARSYLPIGTLPKIDKSYSQYKDPELTPWLKECPSQILRNSSTIWHRSYARFMKGLGGRPKPKNKITGNYIWLTKELFRIRWEGSQYVISIGTEKNPVGEIRTKWNKTRIPKAPPASIWIRRTAYRWHLSFSYDDGQFYDDTSNTQHLDYLRQFSEAELTNMITPVDRGVSKPAHTDNAVFLLSKREKTKALGRDKYIRREQRKLARQQKGSNRRQKIMRNIAKARTKTSNVRANFWHKTTYDIVENSRVVVLEDLKLKNMTKAPAPKLCELTGRGLKNGKRAKAGLNRSILDASLGQFDVFLTYKMARANKPLFKVSPHHTSQECACCGYTHPGNRQNQSDFTCLSCNNEDNADHNAALVIRKRAISLILNSGTELVGAQNNVLRLRTGANSSKTLSATAVNAKNCPSKKKAA